MDIFWDKISNSVSLISFSSNLLIESFIFLLIWITFIYVFSDLKDKWDSKITEYKIEIFYFLYYAIFIFFIYFFNTWIDFFLLTIIISFVFSDILFNHLSNISALEKHKIDVKYIGLILNYVSSGLSVFYIIANNISFIPFFILLFSLIFNVLIHKNYTNYISLIVSILISLFLFYSLFFLIFELYILYI